MRGVALGVVEEVAGVLLVKPERELVFFAQILARLDRIRSAVVVVRYGIVAAAAAAAAEAETEIADVGVAVVVKRLAVVCMMSQPNDRAEWVETRNSVEDLQEHGPWSFYKYHLSELSDP